MKYIHWKLSLGATTLVAFLWLVLARVYEWHPGEVAEAPMFALVTATGFCVCLIQVRRSDPKMFRQELGRVILNYSFAVDFMTRILAALAGWVAAMTWLQGSGPVPMLYSGLAIVLGLTACAGLTVSLFAEGDHRFLDVLGEGRR